MAQSAPNQTPLAPRLHGVAPPPSPSLSLALSYANTRNIFQMLFAFALHTIFAWRARCVPAFSHFSIFHVRFVVVADDTTHIHTLTHTHTQCGTHAHATHYTCIRGFVLLTFSLFFLCDIFFPPFFFFRAAQQFSPPAKRKLSSIACLAVLPLLPWRQIPLCLRRCHCCCCYFPPSVCILNYPWANGLCVRVCVCCCAALPCSHFLLSSFPSSSHLLSNLASWFLFLSLPSAYANWQRRR